MCRTSDSSFNLTDSSLFTVNLYTTMLMHFLACNYLCVVKLLIRHTCTWHMRGLISYGHTTYYVIVNLCTIISAYLCAFLDLVVTVSIMLVQGSHCSPMLRPFFCSTGCIASPARGMKAGFIVYIVVASLFTQTKPG